MVNLGLHSCYWAAVKVTWDVCDLWESKWWAQHRSSCLQILVNWILQDLRRQTPPCMCLRNANNTNQLVNHATDAAGVRVWSALFVGSHGFNLFPSPLWSPDSHSFLLGEVCGCLRAAGCWNLHPSENSWCWGGVENRGPFNFAITVKLQCVEAQLQVTWARRLLKHTLTWCDSYPSLL